MARVTVEDCLKNVKNRFELVMIAAKRARQLMRGKEAHVEWDNDKPTVVALREIAAGYTDFDHHETPEHNDSSERRFIANIQNAINKHEDEKLEEEDLFDDEDSSLGNKIEDEKKPTADVTHPDSSDQE